MIFHIGNYGWARVEIGDDGSIFSGSASYLNDTPIDFLEEFKRCVDNYSTPTIKCDEEGSEFIIVVDEYRTYIISERDETRFLFGKLIEKNLLNRFFLISNLNWIMRLILCIVMKVKKNLKKEEMKSLNRLNTLERG